jgi:hypothetical protein
MKIENYTLINNLMEEEIKIPEQEEVKSIEQGEISETVKEALSIMKTLREKYDSATDPKQLEDLNLYEYPKMMTAIRAVEVENIGRRERGENEFRFEMSDEYRTLRKDDKYGFTKDHLERQRELALEDVEKAKQ